MAVSDSGQIYAVGEGNGEGLLVEYDSTGAYVESVKLDAATTIGGASLYRDQTVLTLAGSITGGNLYYS